MNALAKVEPLHAQTGPAEATNQGDGHAPDEPARVVPMRPTGSTTSDPQGHPQNGPQDSHSEVTPSDPVLAAQLESLWEELARQGAVVNRVPLDAHPDILRARIEHEARRIRALRERP